MNKNLLLLAAGLALIAAVVLFVKNGVPPENEGAPERHRMASGKWTPMTA